MIKFSVFLIAALASASTQAGMLDLEPMMGGANVYTVSDFTSHASDVEGAIVSGGNVTIEGYSVNEKNRAAFVEYSIAAGGNIALRNGSIHNGKTFAGGKTTFDGATAAPDAASRPVNFNASSRQFYRLAKDLSKVSATGTVDKVLDGIVVQGSGAAGAEVFHVSSDLLRDSTDWQLEGLKPGQTLIFNVSGERGSFRDGAASFAPLADYNVLFNFYEAREVDVRGVIGTVLAPYATMRAGTGVVKGNVIVDNWNSSVQVDAGNYFKPVELAGFREAPVNTTPMSMGDAPLRALPVRDIPVREVAFADTELAQLRTTRTPVDIPEPGTLALIAAGLCAASWRVVKPVRGAERDGAPA